MTAWRVRAVLLPHDLPHDEMLDGAITPEGRWSTAPPADAQLLPGRFVLPGLVDAHCHLGVSRDDEGRPVGLDAAAAAQNLATMTATGVTAIRDTGGPVGVTLQLVTRDNDAVSVCGRFLAPAGQYYPALYEPVPAEALIDAAQAEVAGGARWVKLIGDFARLGESGSPAGAPAPTYPLAEVGRLVAAMHQLGVRVAAHSTTEHVKSLIEVGIDSVEHGYGLDEDDLAALAASGGAWTPTLCAFVTSPQANDPDKREQRALIRERLGVLLPRATELGVNIMTGTDIAGTVAREVALLVQFGLEPVAALAAATTQARRFLGLAEFTDGVPVDLVTYHNDPRDDPAVLAAPAAVIARGVRVR